MTAVAFIGGDRLRVSLDYARLIECLRSAFTMDCVVPARQLYEVAPPGAAAGYLGTMPAWGAGGYLGVKIATSYAGNPARGLPVVIGTYWLADAATGVPLAVLDGTTLTRRRTAAVSALAGEYLSREDSRSLLIVGTGAVASELAFAHRCVRPLERVEVWGRSFEKATALAASLRDKGIPASAVDDLEKAVRGADIVSCATSSTAPLVQGNWLRPGTHLDLIGAFTLRMRESDDQAVRLARIYVDTREGARSEAGDLIDPMRRGVINESAIIGELSELVAGSCPGRQSAAQITLFKAVGTARADLAAAVLAIKEQHSADAASALRQ